MASSRRVALITGSATGIGKGIALAFSGGGYDVVINYSRSADRAEETATNCRNLGVAALVVQCDVADDQAVCSMMEACQAEYGRLDVLVNNAGTTMETPPRKMDEVDLDEWDRVFAVNVRGLFQVSRAAAPLLRQSDNASIINTCSIAGVRPGPQPLAYAASKASVANLTRTLAGALGPEIRVNAVAPGWLEGEWMERMLGDNYDGLMGRRAKYTPLKRVATAADVGDVMLNLADHNRFVSGEVIVIDGGFANTT